LTRLPGIFYFKEEVMDNKKGAGVSKLMQNGCVSRDTFLDCLYESSSLEKIRAGVIHATEKFKSYYNLMMDQDTRYKMAKEIGNKELEAEYDKLFYETYELVSYYDSQSERLLKIWSDKTGSPHMVSGEDGLSLYIPTLEETRADKRPHLTVIK
jgi:hypothetical protein